MRLPAIRITVTIGHTQRSWYSAGHDAMLQWNRRERDRYREWVRDLPGYPLYTAQTGRMNRAFRKTACRVCGHTWSWPLAESIGDFTGPICARCDPRVRT